MTTICVLVLLKVVLARACDVTVTMGLIVAKRSMVADWEGLWGMIGSYMISYIMRSDREQKKWRGFVRVAVVLGDGVPDAWGDPCVTLNSVYKANVCTVWNTYESYYLRYARVFPSNLCEFELILIHTSDIQKMSIAAAGGEATLPIAIG